MTLELSQIEVPTLYTGKTLGNAGFQWSSFVKFLLVLIIVFGIGWQLKRKMQNYEQREY